MNKTQNFTEGPILGPLLRFAIPVLFALFLQSLYGAVDLMSKRDPVSLFHIGMATPCSTVTQIILCFACMFYLMKKLKKTE